jgi:hypothetical protein
MGPGFGREALPMKKASEYRQHADECRAMADQTKPGPQRDQLLEMARTWDKLADERSDLIRRHPEQAIAGEHEEEKGRPTP